MQLSSGAVARKRGGTFEPSQSRMRVASGEHLLGRGIHGSIQPPAYRKGTDTLSSAATKMGVSQAEVIRRGINLAALAAETKVAKGRILIELTDGEIFEFTMDEQLVPSRIGKHPPAKHHNHHEVDIKDDET